MPTPMDPRTFQQLSPAEAQVYGIKTGPLTPPQNVPVTIPPDAETKRQQVGQPLKPGTPEYAAWEEEVKKIYGLTPEGRIPTRSILGALVPSVVGALVPPGRTMTRIGGNILGNILGQAGAGAAGEMIDKPAGQRNVTRAAVEGGARGILPGLAQGALGGIFGPGRGTIKAQKMIGSVQGEAGLSPEVAAILDKAKPRAAMQSQTPQKMGEAAGDLLDKMETEVDKKLGDMKFKLMSPSGKLFPRGTDTFIQLRDRIKALREEANYNDHPLWGSRGRAAEARKEANQIESAMLSQMPPDVRQQYVSAMKAHRVNMDAIRFIRGQQDKKLVEGDVNPYDRPGLGRGSKAMEGGPSPSQMAHGALAGVEALLGRPVSASYNVSRAAGRGGKVPDIAESVRGPLASRLPGIAAGTATTLGQDYLAPNKAEAAESSRAAEFIRKPSPLQQQRAGEREKPMTSDFQDFLKLDIAEPLLRLMFAPRYGTFEEPKPVFKR